jgi:hypothetical protein
MFDSAMKARILQIGQNNWESGKEAAAMDKSIVSIVKGTDLGKMVEEVVSLLGGITMKAPILHRNLPKNTPSSFLQEDACLITSIHNTVRFLGCAKGSHTR